ncbi:tRNA (guanosine(37)-N1)-methyltransferase TrmD [candidate division KSB1 bacterium]|nr:tRNA (guanosine(37)-N1)-methyltransferase TrmD [candidate division KSB1 bacterium]RQW04714.1 MAG: tRNA (guanosine(37)-N1)-methyltransferase TrmD [candidate division KSB1 bacterium]
MHIHVITAFPKMFDGFLSESILKRAIEKQSVKIHLHHIRDYATDKHQQIDDYPYGGGPGMILKPDPIFRCIESVFAQYDLPDKVTLLTPSGSRYDQQKAVEMSLRNALVLLCGHYKGIDQRVIDELVDEEISIGDYVITGGELAAMIIIDSVVRLLPGVIGDIDSAVTDSFQTGLLDHPHYTRPETFRGKKVPSVLVSGNHGEIENWRQKKALEITKARRYDLYQKYCENEE